MNCLDTYALVEISKGNPKFSEFIKDEFVITDLTMAEFYIVLRKKHNEQTAQYWHRKLTPFCKPIIRQTLINGLVFREDNRKQNISIFDAAGYIFSKENKHVFVTGNKEFENKTEVLFVKK